MPSTIVLSASHLIRGANNSFFPKMSYPSTSRKPSFRATAEKQIWQRDLLLARFLVFSRPLKVDVYYDGFSAEATT